MDIEDLKPRSYQSHLMEVAFKQNTIIFLPTGSGKTFIAVLLLKQMSEPLQKKYSENGKISIVLVNSVVLVEQHSKVLQRRTHFSIGEYSGEMKVDMWTKEMWESEFDKHQILVMTSQILVNLYNSSYINLNQVNLLIFDECHQGVKDQPMRQVMKNFQLLTEQPRVLGLTATLLNGNCKPDDVENEVQKLEVTYHSKVAAAEELGQVIGYSTNPHEHLKVFKAHNMSSLESFVINLLEDLLSSLDLLLPETKINLLPSSNLKLLGQTPPLKELKNLINDAIIHINMFGTFGGMKAMILYMILIERLKRNCEDNKLMSIYNSVLSILETVKDLFEKEMKSSSLKDQFFNFSSDQILTLVNVFREFKSRSDQDLCCIVFVDRRFTAKILYHVLNALVEIEEFNYIKPNFLIGYQNNPYNPTREGLFIKKQNKKILNSFVEKELNLLVSTNVLEEGVDIPHCSLIVKFDKPKDYRSYVQSKGRARHSKSYYYIMISAAEFEKFRINYNVYRRVEEVLNMYLVGQNLNRPKPPAEKISEMYKENILPPYVVDGPGSAKVDMLSAISLLSQYCESLPADKYTTYSIDYYKEERDESCRVVIVMPLLCPIKDPIQGPYMKSLKNAKRAAALEACKMLHQIGELTDTLKPKPKLSIEEDTSFLFSHYPKEKEKDAGNSKMKRTHLKQIPSVIRGQITPLRPAYIHIINILPEFKSTDDFSLATMLRMYTCDTCYGLVSAQPLPELCRFPVYVSAGRISIELAVNKNTITLTSEQIVALREFHTLVFCNVLEILKPFLMMNNNENAEMLLVVPLRKEAVEIDFDIVDTYKSVKSILEPSNQERSDLRVTEDEYLEKIVVPWYRPTNTCYLVTRVCHELNAYSDFPSLDFSNFISYYGEKHKQNICNPAEPLLLVKGLSKRLNCVKPRGVSKTKRKRDLLGEEMEEHLVAELCIKQDFPAPLWIQATLLPTVLHHVVQLLRADELRKILANEAKVGCASSRHWKALELDEHLLKYQPKAKDNVVQEYRDKYTEKTDQALNLQQNLLSLNKDFSVNMLESEFPWKEIDEPKDIERDLSVTLMDIVLYNNFVHVPLSYEDSTVKKDKNIQRSNLQAITYDKSFEIKPIKLLDFTNKQPHKPELRDVFQALATAKANNIVNLERLETLGDSFLKLLSSTYIMMRFPDFDEGKATVLKSRLISNKNLFYLGRAKNIGGYLMNSDLFPNSQWLPPGYCVPEIIQNKIRNKTLSVRALFCFDVPIEEQISGILANETEKMVEEEDYPVEDNEETDYASLCGYLQSQYIGDKTVADTVEALLGVCFESNGFEGGIQFIEWIGIIPKSENLRDLLKRPPPDPVLNKNATLTNINFHIPHWQEVETRLGYHFQNRAYLLQALTHSSYVQNRITNCYQQLEFLGDAVLDFLITCYIYESCGHLTPGEITDLRSALVNNNTFASYTVRCGFHKFMLSFSPLLTALIDKFVEFQEKRNHVIDDTVLILLQEEDMNLSEHVDVPKVLGDLFEALVGAVYLDCGKDLKIVWNVFYKIMWKEIDQFSQNVPINVVRKLYEKEGVYPKFHKQVEIDNGKTMVKLEFMLNGARKHVYGFGDNKVQAKKAAAKIALRLLENQ